MAQELGKDGRPILAFASQAEWEAWLDAEHRASDGVWIKFAKKGSGVGTVVYAEALDVALCYGWIDSQVKSLDERFYLQKFTPRRARSKWSQVNRAKIEELTKRGRMKPAGLEQVELARADGRWDAAYASPVNVEMPDDLQAALDASPKAAEFWAGLNKSNRFAILYQLQDAKKPETRARRLEKFVGMLERGEKLY
ncbi:MAG TPA: YdeI/OmpD-associated family protein [Gaiellaceae bacterium]|nr:YdeI/OmpD-associated family protein [Gaiellaceae bacterium]